MSTDQESQVSNPFAMTQRAAAPVPSSTIAQAESQRAIATVQAQMMMARANPRDPLRCMDNILEDCQRPSLAEVAMYEYSRGGTAITGPSIRLAEAVARRWGNIASGIKEVRHEGYSECIAYAWDLESGYYDERQFHVEHVRDTRQGRKALTDERDIYELVANMGQRRKRAVLTTVIPGDVFEAAVAQCERTVKAQADTSPAGMAKMVQAFAAFGVGREQIEKRIQRRLDAISPAQVVTLKKIYASLRDDMSTPDQWFDMGQATGSLADVQEAIKGETSKGKSTTTKPPKPNHQDTDHVSTTINAPAVIARINACREPDFLAVIGDELKGLPEGPDKDLIEQAYAQRKAQLTPPPIASADDPLKDEDIPY